MSSLILAEEGDLEVEASKLGRRRSGPHKVTRVQYSSVSTSSSSLSEWVTRVVSDPLPHQSPLSPFKSISY